MIRLARNTVITLTDGAHTFTVPIESGDVAFTPAPVAPTRPNPLAIVLTLTVPLSVEWCDTVIRTEARERAHRAAARRARPRSRRARVVRVRL